MNKLLKSVLKKRENIKNSCLSIYSPIEIGDTHLWYTSSELTEILNQELVGKSFAGLKIRTRSKVAKSYTCEALGYPIPDSFIKVKPRFQGQRFDTYVQKSNNLQVWNEELDLERRYVLIRTNEADIVTKVKVVTGSDLAILDTTGTLTQKFQARLVLGNTKTELISSIDTENLSQILRSQEGIDLSLDTPIAEPTNDKLLSIETIYNKLKVLVGTQFKDAGHIQERNRGGELHKIASKALGYKSHRDDGRFPDIKHQLLEIKLQTSPTIDLGLVCPDSQAVLDIERVSGRTIRHCDVRYALFAATIQNEIVTIKNFYLTTGESFFIRFPQFGGKVLNKKIQIPLPKNFFTE